jgi:hypothetical protein
MIKIKKILARAIAASIAVVGASAFAGDIVVIGNPSAAALTKEQVADLYLGRNQSLTLLDLPESSATRTDYYKKLTGKDPAQIKSMWSRLTFTGKGVPPKELPDGAAVKKAVAADPKTVGYIDKSEVDGTVKVLQAIN